MPWILDSSAKDASRESHAKAVESSASAVANLCAVAATQSVGQIADLTARVNVTGKRAVLSKALIVAKSRGKTAIQIAHHAKIAKVVVTTVVVAMASSVKAASMVVNAMTVVIKVKASRATAPRVTMMKTISTKPASATRAATCRPKNAAVVVALAAMRVVATTAVVAAMPMTAHLLV